jgi:nitronate monooxygenase
MNEPIKTQVTDHFDIQYPIIGAPMFLVSTIRLVVGVSEAGGLGTFPALNYRPIEKYAEAIDEIQSRTPRPFGINVIVQDSNKFRDQHVDIALEKKVPLLITSLGKPKEVIKRAHAVGTKVYCDVIGVEHAKKVVDLGADGLIAVGSGAGGHAGETSPFALIPLLAKNFDVPVLAAGSIVDGKGMAAAFGLGAQAIYMGTRFIACQEAEVTDEYKQAIVQASAGDIISTDKVDGFPGNFIRTPSLEALGLKTGLIEHMIKKSKKAGKWLALSRAARSLFGSKNSKVSYQKVFSAGHGVGLIDSVDSIQTIMDNTVREYQEIKRNLP